MLKPHLISACARCIAIVGLSAFLAITSHAAESYKEDPGTDGNGKHKVGPQYKIDHDLTDRGNTKGKSFEFTMLLADSKIFRGDDSTLQPEKKEVRKERK